MPAAPGLDILNDGTGAGIIGTTTDLQDFGVAGVSRTAAVPYLRIGAPAGVLGESIASYGTGVYGYSGNLTGVVGNGALYGVFGAARFYGLPPGAGPWDYGYGVVGLGRVGVCGYGTARPNSNGAPLSIIGVQGVSNSDRGVGVEGDSDSATGMGILGTSESGAGVVGVTRTGIGVRASVDTSDPAQLGWALLTDGDAIFQGALYVAPGFSKSALVKARDGSHRALYCVESPECWFEDFGRARLVRGRGRVRLDPTFAGVVRAGDYHVFLSPEGLSHGLYVSRRTRNGFEVREQHRGTSTVSFSYRIVARRKDVEAPRFKRVKLPNLAKLARPSRRKPIRAARPSKMPAGVPGAVLERLLGRARSGKSPARGPSRRRDRRR